MELTENNINKNLFNRLKMDAVSFDANRSDLSWRGYDALQTQM